MEAEAARLSALINEAKRSKTVEREKHALLMLKNRPQQVPVTGFTEQLCCMGTTCESWLCAHCRQTDDRTPSVIPHPRTSPLELDAANEVAGKLRSNSSRLRRKTQRRTIANVQDSPAGHAKYTKEAPNRRRSMSVSAKKTKECSHDKKLANERAKVG
ncbi:hypothetical protein OESDEN_07552 [Oesophagostomum dentatum]|uniref:Uncharacterized protein n=1 Tax=Oesophagostomum dentatum TaxID=61180 RepID=A0A0B1TB37_OESDE|nr:hypothetical protein OESDEN_07552 [Oesophagostomum dentatum]